MEISAKTAHRAEEGDPIGNHVEGLASFDFPEAHHHRMQGIQATADRLLQSRNHSCCNPNRINGLMGPRAMTAFTDHFDLQFTSSSRQAAAAQPDRAHRQRWEHMHAKQSAETIGRSVSAHPASTLRDLLSRLKQKAHPHWQGRLLRQQARNPQADTTVQVMAAGMHDPLPKGGIGQIRALLHR